MLALNLRRGVPGAGASGFELEFMGKPLTQPSPAAPKTQPEKAIEVLLLLGESHVALRAFAGFERQNFRVHTAGVKRAHALFDERHFALGAIARFERDSAVHRADVNCLGRLGAGFCGRGLNGNRRRERRQQQAGDNGQNWIEFHGFSDGMNDATGR